jgi:hypothetical protein
MTAMCDTSRNVRRVTAVAGPDASAGRALARSSDEVSGTAVIFFSGACERAAGDCRGALVVEAANGCIEH